MNSDISPTESTIEQDRTDDDLWNEYVQGSDDAFKEIQKRYSESIFRYLLLSGIARRDAAQMLGQVLCHLAAHREHPDGFQSIKEWIFAVTTQQAVPAHVPEERGLMDFVSELKEGEPTDATERLRQDLSDMQRDIRQPFLLVALFGLRVEEAARACRFRPEETARKVELGFRRLTGVAHLDEERE